MSNKLRRVITALVAAPVVLYLAYLGGWLFAGLVACIGVLGQRELYQMARRAGAQPHQGGGVLLGIILVVSILRPSLWPVVGAGVLMFIVLAPFVLPQEAFLFNFTVTIAGIVYPTGLLGSLVWLREVRSAVVTDAVAFQLVLLTLLLVWATDIAAYYVGRTLGTHSLAPTISPNKTWEGTVGGFGAALLVGSLLKVMLIEVVAWPHVLVLIVIGGGVAQMGDLLESRLKRSTDTDDSSQLLPGHGGVLDRFDAMAVAAPVIVLYLDHGAGLF